jgi:hypothetical protein
LDIPWTSYTIKRTTLGIIVVSLDVAIVISLLVSLYILGHYEKLEHQEINSNLVTTEDFAVLIKDLPDYHDFNTLNELKARLWIHLEKVIKAEKQVSDHEKLANSPNNDQIVNIYFGLKSFGKMKILMTIY